MIRGNVVAQLHNLRAQSSVMHAMEEGRLQSARLVLLTILTGRIERYDENQRRFVPLVS